MSTLEPKYLICGYLGPLGFVLVLGLRHSRGLIPALVAVDAAAAARAHPQVYFGLRDLVSSQYILLIAAKSCRLPV